MDSKAINDSKINWRFRLHEIIFEADTRAGRTFDIALVWSIIISLLIVMLDSVRSIQSEYGKLLYAGEWFFTILFTIEYILRLISVKRPIRYVASFFGIIDLLAIVPTYLAFLLPGSHYLIV